VNFEHKATASFWDCYNQLADDLRNRALKQFDLLTEIRTIRPSNLNQSGHSGRLA
jgi:hypothetical protein